MKSRQLPVKHVRCRVMWSFIDPCGETLSSFPQRGQWSGHPQVLLKDTSAKQLLIASITMCLHTYTYCRCNEHHVSIDFSGYVWWSWPCHLRAAEKPCCVYCSGSLRGDETDEGGVQREAVQTNNKDFSVMQNISNSFQPCTTHLTGYAKMSRFPTPTHLS